MRNRRMQRGGHEGNVLEDGGEVESEKPDGGTGKPENGTINEEDDFEPELKGKRKSYARETKLEPIQFYHVKTSIRHSA